MEIFKFTKNKCLVTILLLFLAIYVYFFSSIIVWVGDEYSYSMNYATDRPLETLSDIIQSQNSHYFILNGRYFAHCIVQLFDGFLGQHIFVICNSIVYVLYALLIVKVGKLRYNYKHVFLVVLSMCVCFQTCWGTAYQVGYVWMYLLALLFIYIFFNGKKYNAFGLAGLTVFSLLAGSAQESINIGIAGALIIYAFRNWKEMSAKQWSMMIAFGMGLLVLILSPAAYGRFQDTKGEKLYWMFPILSITYYRIFYVLILFLIYLKKKCKISLKQFYHQNEFYFNVLIICMVFNYIVGVQSSRQLMGVELMSLLILLTNYRKYNVTKKYISIWALCFGMIFVIHTVVEYEFIKCTNKFYSKAEKLYESSENNVIYYNLDKVELGTDFVWMVDRPCYYLNHPWTMETLFLKISGKYPNSEPVKILPTCLKHPEKLRVGNYIIKNAEGNWCVVLDKKHMPSAVHVKRVFDVFGIKVPNWDKVLDFDTDRIYEDDRIIVLQTMIKTAFVEHRDVQFIYD